MHSFANGRSFRAGSAQNPAGECLHHLHRHVHAWRLAAPGRQHALSVDLRRQRRGRVRAGQVPDLLSRVRGRGDVCAVLSSMPQSRHSQRRRLRCDRRRSRRYLLLFPHARVRVLVYNQIVAMPALMVLGFWIVLQVFSGVGSIARPARPRTPAAWPTWPTSAASRPDSCSRSSCAGPADGQQVG